MPTTPPVPGQRLLIDRADLSRTRIAPDPDAPAARALQPGQARLEVAQFALTSNNITYAAFGQAMKYWQFFPAPDPAWGCLPVWGFATVQESLVEGLAVGRRVWGYLPAGTHLVVQPTRLSATGFACGAAHRQDLAAVYNHYSFCAMPTPPGGPTLEGLQAVMRPLFTTSFLLDDFLADHDYFGAQQLLLSSASSKTAYGTALCLALRRGGPGAAHTVGLTSRRQHGFRALRWAAMTSPALRGAGHAGPGHVPTVYVDFAGNAALRRRVHSHFGDALRLQQFHRWHALVGPGQRWRPAGPRPTLFFAPAQVKKRSAPPPEGWGRAGLEERLAQAWAALCGTAPRGAKSRGCRSCRTSGRRRLRSTYAALLQGRADARHGFVLSLPAQPAAGIAPINRHEPGPEPTHVRRHHFLDRARTARRGRLGRAV
jgi:hypothetical protein